MSMKIIEAVNCSWIEVWADLMMRCLVTSAIFTGHDVSCLQSPHHISSPGPGHWSPLRLRQRETERGRGEQNESEVRSRHQSPEAAEWRGRWGHHRDSPSETGHIGGGPDIHTAIQVRFSSINILEICLILFNRNCTDLNMSHNYGYVT